MANGLGPIRLWAANIGKIAKQVAKQFESTENEGMPEITEGLAAAMAPREGRRSEDRR